MSICNLFGFIFVHAFYLVLCIEMREVYWKIKISTDYAFKWLQRALCREVGEKKSEENSLDLEEINFPGPTDVF